ncbi:MAG: universal stress protein [Sphingomonas sp.]
MRSVLIATNVSPAAANAVQRGCLLASQYCAEVTILHVVRRPLNTSDRALLTEDLEDLAAAQARLHPCIPAVKGRLASGRAAETIDAEAARVGADFIVVGGHRGTRWADDLFGTTVERLVRQTGRPVLVVHDPARRPYRRIIAAIENDETARETLGLAAGMSSADTLFAVHAFLPTLPQLVAAHGDQQAIRETEQRSLEKTVHAVLGERSDIACVVHPVARRGDPVSVITRAWEQFRGDLVVAVTRGRTGLALALRGSFADMLIEEAPFDLLLQHRP